MAREGKIKVKFIYKLFLLLAIIASGFAIYEIYLLNSIEDVLRAVVMGALVMIDIFFIWRVSKTKRKRTKHIGLIFGMIFYILICSAIGGAIFYIYGQLSSINKETVTYTSDLVVLKDNSATKIEDVNNMKIGMLNDKKNPEGYIIPNEVIDKYNLQDENEIKEYEDYTSMITDLYSEDLDSIFITDNYVSMYESIPGYENIGSETRIIFKQDKKMKKAATSKQETASSGKNIKEPFTILLMGIDSTDEVLEKNAIANGDTLILITFNPKTLNATMLSIPRDSYVPISCWSGKPENKITHAAAYGNDCMINTIEDYFDVDIDYYAKINFKGLVKLVDAVGGVEVDVPKKLCTDNSGRGGQVCINPGHQTLNGEEALVFARNRKQLANGDFGRAQHQQELIMALINKMKDIRDVSKFTGILKTISNSLDTNLTTKQILSFYNIGKDIVTRSSDQAELINIQQLYLEGTGEMIYDERARMVLWDYIPSKSSRKVIIQAMKENLELAEHKPITEFSFSINEPYEKKVIGQGVKDSSGYNLMPDFTGDTEAQARATCSKLGITCTFKGSGHVTSQSVPFRSRLDKNRSVVLTLGSGKDEEDEKTTKKDEEDEKTKPSEDDTSSGDDQSGGQEDQGGQSGGNSQIDPPQQSGTGMTVGQ